MTETLESAATVSRPMPNAPSAQDGTGPEFERALNTGEAARFLGLGKSTLERMRVTGGGPSYRKLPGGVGRCVYLVSELREWRDRFKRNSTSEQPASEPQAA